MQEATAGKGEDARPVVLRHPDREAYFLAVLDGMGGAGAARHVVGNQTLTGASIAARACARAIEAWFQGSPAEAWTSVLAGDPAPLTAALQRTMDTLPAAFERGSGSLIKSRMIKRFPTTLAAMAVERTATGSSAICFSAGDSRCYRISNAHGLQQLTKDDIRDDIDPFANLGDDGVLSRMISASEPVRLTTSRFPDGDGDDLYFCATDGVFHYWQSPMQFAYRAMRILIDENRPELGGNLAVRWAAGLRTAVSPVTADDHSLAAVLLTDSTQSPATLGREPAFVYLLRRLHDCDRLERRTDLDALQRIWDAYRTNYCAYLATGTP